MNSKTIEKEKEVVIRMCDISIKVMQDKPLTQEEWDFAYKYFMDRGLRPFSMDNKQ